VSAKQKAKEKGERRRAEGERNSFFFAFRLSVFAFLFLAGCEWQRETLLYVRDEVCKTGESVKLTAKLEENNWRWEDVKGKPVSFWIVNADGKYQFIGGDVTDGEARGSGSFMPPAPGDYTIECQFAGASRLKPASYRAGVFCKQATRYGIILDIDNTLAATTLKDAFAGRFRLALPLDQDTVRVVNALAKEYELFIVTSRPRTQAPTVLEWLSRNGFPRVPTFFYDPRAEAIRPATAKRKILQELKREYPLIAIGIGDREGDIEGYMSEGLLALGIGREERGTFSVRSWSDVEAILLSTPKPESVPSELIVTRGKETVRFWLSEDRGGWKLEYALKTGQFHTEAPRPWPEQLKKILQLITTP
jgi:hypothetical protein